MKFAYWSREVAGWLLILGGLFFFLAAYNLLLNRRVFEAGPLVFVGFIVFRGGIHLLKVAVAARICTQAPPLAFATDRGGRTPAAVEQRQPLEW